MQRLAGQVESDPAIAFLRSRIDYERTSMVPYGRRDFHLDRMRLLLSRLGNPQEALAIVHVAGTKGKGSTAATIASILRAAGFRTGLYSSPHLDRVEERLAVDGALCPPDELRKLVERIQPVVAVMDAAAADDDPASGGGPTYFEIITALALLRFAECRVDVAVLEVGLGGRLDSTNVCEPLVSVITSISFDHMQQLGNTLSAIAGEKAGIIKRGRPVVSGVLQDEPREVVAARAREQGCMLIQLGREFDFAYRPPRRLEIGPAQGRMDFWQRSAGVDVEWKDLALNLLGAHQASNAAVGIAVATELVRQGWKIPPAAIRQGLAEVCWPARVEVLRRRPTVVLDAAHNLASVEALVRVLDESFANSARLLVFATTRDKDARGMLQLLLPKFDEVILTRYWNNPRSVPPEELDEIAAASSASVRHVCQDAPTAWSLASRIATPEHLVCITGSFFIAAEMRAAMQQSGES